MKDFLDQEAARVNRPEFIKDDPIQFPREFERIEDIEIVSFLASTLAWGNRSMICRDISKMLSLMDHQPFNFTMDQGYEEVDPDINIHRTFFGRHLQHFLRGLRKIYLDYGSIDAFAQANGVGDEHAPAWKLVELMNKVLREENSGEETNRCMPLNLNHSALKRVNMALRWLVRDDGIVDMGIWKSIPKNKLYIPLDVHVGNVSRELGLLNRKQNDRKSVEELTGVLRTFRPEDPAYYDFALFGIGIMGKNLSATVQKF